MVRLEYKTSMGRASFDLDDYDRERVQMGRSAKCDLSFPLEKVVSRVHAFVEWRGERWFLSDADSMHGTFVNGKRVGANHPLRDGDEIRLATSVVLWFIWDETEQTDPTTPGEKPPALTPGERRGLKELVRPHFKLVRPGKFVEPATVAEIATRLTVGEGAVKAHLQAMYVKFLIDPGPRRRLRLADEAIDRKAITDEDYADEPDEPDDVG